MRKFFFSLLLLILGLAIASLVAWMNRSDIAAHLLSRELKVPVSIDSLEIHKTRANLSRLWIGNPLHSKTSTSFSAETMSFTASLKELLGNPLLIEEIILEDIFIGIEYYDLKGKDNNWSRILAKDPREESKKDSRNYEIKTLILKNLTVEVTQANGSIQRYPTIKNMEFHGISNETGFPVDEIEKAIFERVLKDIFKKFNLDLLESIDPFKKIPGGSPLKFIYQPNSK